VKNGAERRVSGGDRMSDTALARSSDDFWPRDPASHTTHVAVNALNSLFMSPLVQPDWDMFHSKHPAALMHARARVVRVPSSLSPHC
jgi:raffinose synthase